MSYLTRHRPICTVLQEIQELAQKDEQDDIVTLCEEAINYARSMSLRLTQFREKEAQIERLLELTKEKE